MRVRRVPGHDALYSLSVLIEQERLGLERQGIGGGPEAADPGGGAASRTPLPLPVATPTYYSSRRG